MSLLTASFDSKQRRSLSTRTRETGSELRRMDAMELARDNGPTRSTLKNVSGWRRIFAGNSRLLSVLLRLLVGHDTTPNQRGTEHDDADNKRQIARRAAGRRD